MFHDNVNWRRIVNSKLKIVATGFILTILTIRAFAATSIAVVPIGIEANKHGDILTTQLSKLPAVTLLERAQIDKLLSEQALAATQQRDFIKLGRTLNAEGMVVLERRIGPGTNDTLAVRVIAVRPGVIITENHFPLPLPEPLKWAESYSTQFERMLPKLSVSAADAVAVSVGSLRSSLSTGDAGSLEQELTALLRLRLAHEPTVFLLERRSMEALQNEKDVAAEEEPFWNGTFIIDGTINRDIVSQSSVTIDARVAAPNVPAIQVRVDGRRESLPELANKLVTNILVSIGKKKAPTAWQTQAEAEKFLQEAQWAARWGLWQQVSEAADASWALGKRDVLVGGYRVVARAWLALSMRGYRGWEPADAYGFRPQPSPEALPMAIRMLEVYQQGLDVFSAGTNSMDGGWLTLGIALLPVSARMLEHYYDPVERREGHEEDLGRVRALARQLNQSLTTNSSKWPSGWRYDFGAIPPIYWHTKNGPVQSLPAAWFDSEGIWFDSPRDAVAFYRQYVSPSGGLRLIGLLGPRVPLAGWSVKDREQLHSIWTEFLQEMIASTNLQSRLDGMRLMLTHSNDPDILVSTAERLVEEIARNRVIIFWDSLFWDGANAPVDKALTALLARMEPWGTEQSKKLALLRDAAVVRLNDQDPEFSYEIWKHFLVGLTNAKATSLPFRSPPAALSPDRAREIISEIERIQREKRTRWPVNWHLSQLKAFAEPKVPSNQVNTSQMPKTAISDVPTVTISRVWRQEEQVLPAQRIFHDRWSLGEMFWQNGRLWMAAQTYGTRFQGAEPKLAFLKFDLATMRAEVIETPFELQYPPGYRRMLVAGQELFVVSPNAVWRRDAAGEWKQFPVPTSGAPLLWGRNIVLSTAESILQLSLDTGELRVLASMRRTPPASALDQLNLDGAVVAVWPGNVLCAAAGGRVWKFDPKSNDWHAFITATNCSESLQLEPQGVFYRQPGECGGLRLFGGWRPGIASVEYYTWTPTARIVQKVPEFITPPLWTCPTQSISYNRIAQFDGPNVWIFPALFSSRPFLREQSPPTVLFLDHQLDRALEIDVAFAASLKEDAELYKRAPASFFPTHEGLAIRTAEPEVRLFWVPKTDLQSALAKARQRQNALGRPGAPDLIRFDRNADGWLDDVERRTMRHDAAWQRESSTRISAAGAAALKKHGSEWDNLFTGADKNKDGRLSSLEFASIATNQVVFGKRLQGVNGSALQVTRPYDLNNDSALDRNEFKEFMADPRLPAEVLRSASWVTKFGLKVEACDTNDDGILDSAERTQTYRLIRQKLGQSGRESN